MDMNEKVLLAHQRLTMAFLSQYGVHEIAGSGANPAIVEYHSKTSLRATSDEVPWCSSITMWAALKAGMHVGRTNAAARSWATWGENYPFFTGAIAVFENHVGVALRLGDGGIYLLGGNQANAVNVQLTKRSDFIGYRCARLIDLA